MGYMRHHMIVVTSCDDLQIQEAHAKALEIFSWANMGLVNQGIVGVTPIFTSPVNHYYTFFVPPDGSKEGWSDSEDGDTGRALFIEWLNAQRHEDSSTCLKWAEVQYGDEEQDNRVLRHDGEVVPGSVDNNKQS